MVNWHGKKNHENSNSDGQKDGTEGNIAGFFKFQRKQKEAGDRPFGGRFMEEVRLPIPLSRRYLKVPGLFM